MTIVVLTLILFISEYLFILLASKYDIYDNPNYRSSHSIVTIRGGGIVYWFAAVTYFVVYFPKGIMFFAGLTIVSIVSFIDDLHRLHRLPRLFAHLAGATMVFISIRLFNLLPWFSLVVVYILYLGILNAYNFMDGINGITGLYSISVLGALQYLNLKIVQFAEPDLIWFPIIASVVFLFFNFRKKALCFAGDVGSISIAFWIVSLLILLMVKTGSVIWILLLALYGVDTVSTIIHRIWLRQNIFVAHRLHFFQVLANEKAIDHRIVSTGYALAQGMVSVFVICMWNRWPGWLTGLVVLLPLTLIYCLKFRMLKQDKRQK